MSKNRTVKNHFVPNKYLKLFKHGSNVKVTDINADRVFYVNETRNIGFKNNLYTLTNKLEDKDLDFFCEFFNVGRNEVSEYYLNLLKIYLNNDLFRFITLKGPDGKSLLGEMSLPDEFKHLFSGIIPKFDTKIASRNQENLFTIYENNYWPVLDKLLKKDISFFREYPNDSYYSYQLLHMSFNICDEIIEGLSEELKSSVNIKANNKTNSYYYDLFTFIISQYFRVSILDDSSTESNLSAINEYVEIDLIKDKMLAFYRHFKYIDLIDTLTRDDYYLILLDNKTNVKFITSDRPAINLNSVNDENVEIYYVVSPELSILITNKDEYGDSDVLEINDELEIIKYNSKLKSLAFRFLYGEEKRA